MGGGDDGGSPTLKISKLTNKKVKDMTRVLVAAWSGLLVGWIGFGWLLSMAPAGDMQVRTAQIEVGGRPV